MQKKTYAGDARRERLQADREAKVHLYHLSAGVVFGRFGAQNHPRHRVVVVEIPGAEKHEGGVI